MFDKFIMSKEQKEFNSFSDDVQELFDLVKEGVSYIIHVYLFLISKTCHVDFIERLFDNHKQKSTYDFSKDGKTFLYRVVSTIFKVEKHILSIGLQYLYNAVPIPFMKNLYESFCTNNDFECTDIQSRKCKQDLKNESNEENSLSRRKQSKRAEQNDDSNASKPFMMSVSKLPFEPEENVEESLAPVGKIIHTSLEDQNKAFQQSLAENQANLQKNIEDFNKSMQNTFPLGNIQNQANI